MIAQSESNGSRTFAFGQAGHPWEFWCGQRLRHHFALDTETSLIVGHKVPRFILASVSDGQQTYIVQPHNLAWFLTEHLPDGHMICHHIGFDFWVLDRHLSNGAHGEARSWLWSAVDQQRVHDTMLLADLVTLATSDQLHYPSLAAAAKRWLGIDMPKDQYRTTFEQIEGQDWNEVDQGYFEYAAADVLATYQLFCRLTAEAKQITDRHGATRKYGFLSEAIQVRAAVAMDRIRQLGLHIDLKLSAQLRDENAQEIEGLLADLEKHYGPDLFHRYKRTGERKPGPQINESVLSQRLLQIAAEHNIEVPATPSGKCCLKVKDFWKHHRPIHPAIDTYCHYKITTKQREFIEKLTEPEIHPRYSTLVRTGRTSCTSPNLQQQPRGSRVREAIVASPGSTFLIIDYSAIEMCTLAAICQARYGYSKLGDVLRAGTDPHKYTAAMFYGLTLDQFDALPKLEMKEKRQQAKAINFGIPGGMSPKTLVSYAYNAYDVQITFEQADQFHQTVTQQVYPELGMYLAQDRAADIALTLQADSLHVRTAWPEDWCFGVLKKVVEGNTTKANGEPYSENMVNRVWHQLESLNRNPQLAAAIANRDTSQTSPLQRLMFSPVQTETGRIRGGVPYTASRNTPFQALAGDGAKLAMWELLKAGYDLVGFIHDEFLIELSLFEDCTAHAKRIERICIDAMQILVGDIPVKCEYALARRWYKQAEAVFDSNGELQLWEPDMNSTTKDRIATPTTTKGKKETTKRPAK